MAQQIEHTHLPIRGLNLHVAQVGKGELGTVVFLHGFPEIWYSRRHQMLAVAAAGVPCHRAGQPRLRPVGPAAGGRGGHLGGPRRRRARHPRRPLHPKAGLCGGQGLRRRPGVRLRAAAPGPHPRRGVPGHPLQPRALQLRQYHAGGLLHPPMARAWEGGGRLRPARRPALVTNHVHPLLPQRGPGRQGRGRDHGPRRLVHAAAAVVHGGGPRRVRRILREVRLPLPSGDTVQGSAPDDDARGRQVSGTGVHGDGGERLLPQVPRLRERPEERRHGHLRP